MKSTSVWFKFHLYPIQSSWDLFLLMTLNGEFVGKHLNWCVYDLDKSIGEIDPRANISRITFIPIFCQNIQILIASTEKLSMRNFHMKKLRIKCWWNWLQIRILSSKHLLWLRRLASGQSNGWAFPHLYLLTLMGMFIRAKHLKFNPSSLQHISQGTVVAA